MAFNPIADMASRKVKKQQASKKKAAAKKEADEELGRQIDTSMYGGFDPGYKGVKSDIRRNANIQLDKGAGMLANYGDKRFVTEHAGRGPGDIMLSAYDLDPNVLSGIAGATSGARDLQHQALTDALASRGQAQGAIGALGAAGAAALGATPEATQRLYGIAGQQGPSVAQMQLQQGLESSIAASRAQAASAQGVSPALAARMAQRGAEGAQRGAVRDAAFLRASEQQADLERALRATEAAGGLTHQSQELGMGGLSTAAEQYGNIHGQDVDRYGSSAGRSFDYTSLGLDAAGADREGRVALEGAITAGDQYLMGQYGQGVDDWLTQYGIDRGFQSAKRGQDMQLAGSVIGGIAAGASAAAQPSDERVKKDIKPGGKDIDKFLGALKASKYRYKRPEEDGRGPRYSVMAQQLLRSKVGKTFVRSTPRGLMVDYGAGLGAMLAAQAHLSEKIRKLEKRSA